MKDCVLQGAQILGDFLATLKIQLKRKNCRGHIFINFGWKFTQMFNIWSHRLIISKDVSNEGGVACLKY